MYGHNDYRDYLAHYGVPGMKWENHLYTNVTNGKYEYGNKSSTGLLKLRSPKKKRSGLKVENESLLSARKSDDKLKTEDESLLSAKKDKDLDSTANDIIRGKYGVGDERRKTIEKLGMSYAIVQNRVNEILGSKFRHKVTDADKKKMEDYKSKSSKTSKSSKSSGKKKKKKATQENKLIRN